MKKKVLEMTILLIVKFSLTKSYKKNPIKTEGIVPKRIRKNSCFKWTFLISIFVSVSKNVATPKREPRCILVKIKRFNLPEFWNNSPKISKCKEELTGMNSVIPWTTDRTIISIMNEPV